MISDICGRAPSTWVRTRLGDLGPPCVTDIVFQPGFIANWYLTELAAWLHANHRSHFLLTAPPLRLPGAVGSPATPVATV